MKRFLILTILIAITVGSSSAFTWPEAFPYDGLLSNESVDFLGLPNAWHIRGGAQYVGITNKYFDDEGKNVSDYGVPPDASESWRQFENYGNSRTVIPFTLGYNMMSVARIDITSQLVRYYWADDWAYKSTSNITEEMGIGDVWIVARGMFSEGDGWYLCPRGAVKFNLGGDSKYINDGQVDFDIAVQFGKLGGEDWFRGTGSLGYRYRLPKNREIDSGTEKYKPGAMMYITLDPGIAVFPGFELYLPVNALYYTDEVVEGDRKEGTSGNGVAIGLKPRYTINRNFALDAHFITPLLGKNINNEMLFGINAEVYSPL